MHKTGRTERVIDAHKGAVMNAKWNHDGTSLLTSGEDGQLKIWSRSGMLRSTHTQRDSPIYSAVWSPFSTGVLYSSGKTITIQYFAANSKVRKIFIEHHKKMLNSPKRMPGIDWTLIRRINRPCSGKRTKALCSLWLGVRYPTWSLAVVKIATLRFGIQWASCCSKVPPDFIRLHPSLGHLTELSAPLLLSHLYVFRLPTGYYFLFVSLQKPSFPGQKAEKTN